MLLQVLDDNDFEMMKIFKSKFMDYLKYYYYVGGMPEAVLTFITNRDLKLVSTDGCRYYSFGGKGGRKSAGKKFKNFCSEVWSTKSSQDVHVRFQRAGLDDQYSAVSYWKFGSNLIFFKKPLHFVQGFCIIQLL